MSTNATPARKPAHLLLFLALATAAGVALTSAWRHTSRLEGEIANLQRRIRVLEQSPQLQARQDEQAKENLRRILDNFDQVKAAYGQLALKQRDTLEQARALALDEARRLYQSVLPTGIIICIPAGKRLPIGYVRCDGREVFTSDYPILAEILRWPEGPGIKANLPNMTPLVPKGFIGAIRSK